MYLNSMCLCTLYLLAWQVRATEGELGLCCLCLCDVFRGALVLVLIRHTPRRWASFRFFGLLKT